MQLADPNRERFARLVANGATYTEAATCIGSKPSCAPNQGSRLAKEPEVKARIIELQALRHVPVCVTANIHTVPGRVAALHDRWERMRRIIAERAEDPEMQVIAGGKTGLLVKTVKQVGSGPNAQIVDEYRVDTGLLAEIRAVEDMAAQELGQRTTRRESYTENLSLNVLSTTDLRAVLDKQLEMLPLVERKTLAMEFPALQDAMTADQTDPAECADIPSQQWEDQEAGP